METLTPEMIEKARSTKTAEELLALAKEAGMEDFTEESAEAYFALLHPATGAVADDELESVAGGGCYNKDELVVTLMTTACEDRYVCKYCGARRAQSYPTLDGIAHSCGNAGSALTRDYLCNLCGNCRYIKYERGLWLCSNSQKRK